jgi:hypothetical protein
MKAVSSSCLSATAFVASRADSRLQLCDQTDEQRHASHDRSKVRRKPAPAHDSPNEARHPQPAVSSAAATHPLPATHHEPLGRNAFPAVAKAEGNRTPLTEVLGHNGFEASNSKPAATPLSCTDSR